MPIFVLEQFTDERVASTKGQERRILSNYIKIIITQESFNENHGALFFGASCIFEPLWTAQDQTVADEPVKMKKTYSQRVILRSERLGRSFLRLVFSRSLAICFLRSSA
jgi:hypothetical protein